MVGFAQSSNGDAALGGLVLIGLAVLGVAFYFLPTIVAFLKKTPSKASVVIINLFLGWTFIGWVVALAMAFRDPTPTQQVVVYNQPGGDQLPPPSAPPAET